MIWQSFDHLTDSLLPSVRLSLNEKIMLLSWKSPLDPAGGRFRLVPNHDQLSEFFIWDGDTPYWRSGPWNGYLFLGIPYMHSEFLTGFGIIRDPDGTLELSYTVSNQSLLERLVLSYDGRLFQKDWDGVSRKWETAWQSLESQCDIYGKCGSFGICNPRNSPICDCSRGFKPKNNEEWSKGNWTSGCVRKTLLQCGTTATGGKADGFFRLKHMKVPDKAQWMLAGPDNCKPKCLENCSCIAYVYYSGIGCMFWTEKLSDVQQFSAEGADLFIRLAHSELGESNKWKVIIPVVVISGTATFAVSFFVWRLMFKCYGKKSTDKGIPIRNNKFSPRVGQAELQEFPLFEYEKLMTATSNFSENNKLGQGGFGIVYKGILEDGREIAVKRLSRASKQGVQEFMNEVVVITKLQHINLVRLLGCCVEREENLLVFEYMPNKSLDTHIFDPLHRGLLDWKKRFNIIKGICRGVLYLHRDSRLRIIHRDLKASNILLDEDLDPKISDFGMARIFEGKQDKANTMRIVGTYGYMSPEYAMEGHFSEKSDVYSFGVLLLEIVSGRRNSSFYNNECLSLVGYVWKLWNEDDLVSLVNPTILNLSYKEEICRCIQVGLLCVEEIPEDRPTMSMVISMLDNDVTNLACPVKPGFPQRRINGGFRTHRDGEQCSVATLDSPTALSGR